MKDAVRVKIEARETIIVRARVLGSLYYPKDSSIRDYG